MVQMTTALLQAVPQQEETIASEEQEDLFTRAMGLDHAAFKAHFEKNHPDRQTDDRGPAGRANASGPDPNKLETVSLSG